MDTSPGAALKQTVQSSGAKKIDIHPDKMRHFGEPEGASFYLVTNQERVGQYALVNTDGRYASTKVLGLDSKNTLENLIKSDIPEPAHILVISPGKFLVSPNPEALGKRKLIVMPCASTPADDAVIEHFIKVVERSDPDAEREFVSKFFDLGRASNQLKFINDDYSTLAVFDHLDDSYEWNVQAGPLDWGDQQIAPSGELSVCPVSIMEFDNTRFLEINGEITLQGPLAIHCGTPSYYEEDRMRLHASLSTMQQHPVIIKVEHGRVTDVRATHKNCEPAVDALKALIKIDSRYGVLWECGFGINTKHDLLPGNIGMNEPYGADHGCSHWGLGLTPYTQYALILLAPGTRVTGKDGAHLIGATSHAGGMKNVKKGACGCHSS